MKIFYSPYQLKMKMTGKSRLGALLKIDFDEGITGYADCHPWPEVGDAPLEKQIELIKNRQTSALINCALECAYQDAQARAQGKSLLADLKIPASHYLGFNLLDWQTKDSERIIEEGFKCVKFKVGRVPSQEIEQLLKLFYDSPLRLRLDFNNSLDYQSFSHFLKSIEVLKDKVDFIEDPFFYMYEEWKTIQANGWHLACDRQAALAFGHSEAARYLIIKPSLMLQSEMEKKAEKQIKIVTSYAGHPFEQLYAAYFAARLDLEGKYQHGLLSHRLFEKNSFSQKLNGKGPCFSVPKGIGWGFDEELNQLEFQFIK